VATALTAFFVGWREGDVVAIAFAQSPPPARNEQDDKAATPLELDIQRILTEQQRAWNRGDIDDFMAHYLKSDELTFSSGGRVTRGWQSTLVNYRKRYPDRATMGNLDFTQLEVRPLGEEAALVLGNWHLERKSHPDVGGNFTLILQRIDERWLIVHDHTSRLEALPETEAKDKEDRRP
jgi:beta-aspartyl-peptidase (threonine type)